MEIRDVIGNLREKYLELQGEINALRLAQHLIEYRLTVLDQIMSVSRETAPPCQCKYCIEANESLAREREAEGNGSSSALF